MSPDDMVRLRHMAEAARAALGFCHGRVRAELESDAMLRFALTQALQVVGEAAANVSADGRALAPGIEWAEIVGMRNRLVHAYFDINTDILWATAMVSLPTLLQRLRLIEGVDQPGAP